jgi:hypothetical protein
MLQISGPQRAAAISNANAKNDNASSRKGGRNSHK